MKDKLDAFNNQIRVRQSVINHQIDIMIYCHNIKTREFLVQQTFWWHLKHFKVYYRTGRKADAFDN